MRLPSNYLFLLVLLLTVPFPLQSVFICDDPTTARYAARDFLRYREKTGGNASSIDRNMVPPLALYDHLGDLIGAGWKLTVREPLPKPVDIAIVELPAEELVQRLNQQKVVGREMVWVERQWLATSR